MLFDFVQPGGMMSHDETEYLERLDTMLLLLKPVIQTIKYVTIMRCLSFDQHLHNPQRASFYVVVQHIPHCPWFFSYCVRIESYYRATVAELIS